ncbi:MAG: hypothetical protein QX199_15620 [Methylococcaceae bacterium]
MQTQITVDNQDIVIRIPKDSMSKAALANFLDYVELMALNQNSRLKQEQADDLARKINNSVWQSLRSKVLR